MKNEMKKLRVCSKKKVLRLVQRGEIDFVNNIFINKVTGEPVKVQLKTKYRDDSEDEFDDEYDDCLLYTSPSPRDLSTSRMPSSA